MPVEFKKSGIYTIRNIINGKFYIGSAKHLDLRWSQHLYELRKNKHPNRHLQFAYNKYWEFNFQYLIIEYCDLIDIVKREQFWIDLTNCCNDKIGYNINPTAYSNLGRKFNVSKEHRDKIGLVHKGKITSEETKKKMSDVRKNNPKYRKVEKWPCEAGIRCKCIECKERKRIYMNLWRKSRIEICVQ